MKPLFIVVVMIALALASPARSEGRHVVISTLIDPDPVALIGIRVMTEAYQRLGITMEIKHLPGERALQTSNNGLVDGELFRKKDGITQLYPNLIRVPVAISIAEFVVFTKDKRFPVEGWQSLTPYKVGYVRGIKAIDANLVKGTRIEMVTDHAQAFGKLLMGRTDVVVAVRATGLAILKEKALKGVVILEPPLLVINNYHYLHKKNIALVAPLTAVLQQMEKEGFIQHIIDQVIQDALE